MLVYRHDVRSHSVLDSIVFDLIFQSDFTEEGTVFRIEGNAPPRCFAEPFREGGITWQPVEAGPHKPLGINTRVFALRLAPFLVILPWNSEEKERNSH